MSCASTASTLSPREAASEGDAGAGDPEAHDDQVDVVGCSGESGSDAGGHGVRYLRTSSVSSRSSESVLMSSSVIVAIESTWPWAASTIVRAS